jgi:hypothetical protein
MTRLKKASRFSLLFLLLSYTFLHPAAHLPHLHG